MSETADCLVWSRKTPVCEDWPFWPSVVTTGPLEGDSAGNDALKCLISIIMLLTEPTIPPTPAIYLMTKYQSEGTDAPSILSILLKESNQSVKQSPIH